MISSIVTIRYIMRNQKKSNLRATLITLILYIKKAKATPWIFKIAMKNGPFINNLPIFTS